MRIIFYYPSYIPNRISGIHDAALVLIKQMKALGHEAVLYSKYDLTTRAVTYNDINTADTVVICSSTVGLDIHLLKTDVVLWCHGWEYLDGVKQFLPKFSKIIALSPKHAEHLKTEYWCYNCYDDTIFYEDQSVPRDPSRVLYCGGFKWWKGCKCIPIMRRMIEHSRYSLRLDTIYNLTHTELAKEFCKSGMVFIPSITESFSLVSVQGQACGCIPVCHDVGGVSETICDEMKEECLYPMTAPGNGKISELSAQHIVRARAEFDRYKQLRMRQHLEKFKPPVVCRRFLELMV